MRRAALAQVELDRVRSPSAVARRGRRRSRSRTVPARPARASRAPIFAASRGDLARVGDVGGEAAAEIALPARAAEQLVVRREQLDVAERRHPQLHARAAEAPSPRDPLLDDAALAAPCVACRDRARRVRCSNAIASSRARSAAGSSAAPGAGRSRRSTSALPLPETLSFSLTMASCSPARAARISASGRRRARRCRACPRGPADGARRRRRRAGGNRSSSRTTASAGRRRRAGCRAPARGRARAATSCRGRGGRARGSGISARIRVEQARPLQQLRASGRGDPSPAATRGEPGAGVRGDDARQEDEVVVDDRSSIGRPVTKTSCSRGWRRSSSRNSMPLLVDLDERARAIAGSSGVIDGTTTSDSPGRFSRMARQTGTRRCCRRSKRSRRCSLAQLAERRLAAGALMLTRAPWPRRARDVEGPRRPREPCSVRSPTGSATTDASTAACTRWPTRIWPGCRGRAEPRGEVRDAADRRVVGAPLEADPPERGVPLRRCRPRSGGRGPCAASPRTARPTRSRIATAIRTARSGPVRARQRVVEEHHHAVAGEPLEGALEAVDELAERRVVGAEHAHHVLRLGRLGERREAAQVAEDDRDLAAVALQERLVAGADHEVDELGRQEAPQPAEPLQLVDLLRHALLQRRGSTRRAPRPAPRSCRGSA